MTKKIFAVLLATLMLFAMSTTASAEETNTNVESFEITFVSEDSGIMPLSEISGYYSGTVSRYNPKCAVPLNSDGTGGVGITIVTSASYTEAIRVTAKAFNDSGSHLYIDNALISTIGTYYFVDGITQYNDKSVTFEFTNLTQDMNVTIYVYG